MRHSLFLGLALAACATHPAHPAHPTHPAHLCTKECMDTAMTFCMLFEVVGNDELAQCLRGCVDGTMGTSPSYCAEVCTVGCALRQNVFT